MRGIITKNDRWEKGNVMDGLGSLGLNLGAEGEDLIVIFGEDLFEIVGEEVGAHGGFFLEMFERVIENTTRFFVCGAHSATVDAEVEMDDIRDLVGLAGLVEFSEIGPKARFFF